jgi:hypothetical protein
MREGSVAIGDQREVSNLAPTSSIARRKPLDSPATIEVAVENRRCLADRLGMRRMVENRSLRELAEYPCPNDYGAGI